MQLGHRSMQVAKHWPGDIRIKRMDGFAVDELPERCRAWTAGVWAGREHSTRGHDRYTAAHQVLEHGELGRVTRPSMRCRSRAHFGHDLRG